MLFLIELWESVRGFIATGGNVLYVVAFALLLMWIMMIERYWFLSAVYPAMKKNIVSRWDARSDTTSWYAHRIRETWISEANELLEQRMVTIRTLVAMCPLIGLLGTVTGMIGVFETMAQQGTGNPRLMAAGISQATIPTMAGMVAALSGVFFSSRLDAQVKLAKAKLVDSLPHHQRDIFMARKKIREDEEAAIDMTPMLDIVFIMLIFFIVTTSFVKEAGIEVNKPKAAQQTKQKNANIFIAVKDNGEIWLDKGRVDIERVGARIEKLLAEQPTDVVIIQADKDAKHGVVVKVMDAIKEAGSGLRISIAAAKG